MADTQFQYRTTVISSLWTQDVNNFIYRPLQNVAALRAVLGTGTPLPGPQAWIVRGYYAPGDGGGGVYYRDPNDVMSADNGGTIIVANDGSRWKLLHEGKVSCRQFGAKFNGTADDSGAINNALASGVGIVLCTGGGTALVASTISVPANTFFLGDRNTTIKLGVNADLLDYGGAHAVVQDIIFDGNFGAFAFSDATTLIRMASNYGTFYRNIVQNSNGICVAVNTGQGNSIRENECHDFYSYAFFLSGNGSTFSQTIIKDNKVYNIGWGACEIGVASDVVVDGNQFIGQLNGGPGNRLTVNTSGTTVTYVSGTNFANAKVGNFLVINGGQEYRIIAVNSNTSLTVSASLPTLTNAQASVGGGDMVGVIAAQNVKIIDNYIWNNCTFGVALSVGGNSASCTGVDIRGNHFSLNGKNAVNISYDSGTGIIDVIKVQDNQIQSAGAAGGNGTTDQISIFCYDGVGSKVNDVFIDGNFVTSGTGDGQTQYWLGTNGGLNFGSIKLGHNAEQYIANGSQVYNDVKTITLSSGWGSTASASSIVSYGLSVTFQIVSSGTGQSANPNFTITKICDSALQPAMLVGNVSGLSGPSTATAFLYGLAGTGNGSWQGSYGGSVAAGNQVGITVKA